MQLEGVVKRINAKPYNSRRGSGVAYSFLLIQDTGEETWVTFGFDKEPPFEEGDRINVSATEKNGYLNYVEGSGRIVNSVTAKSVGQGIGGGNRQGAGTGSSASVPDQSAVSGVTERAAKEADRQSQIVWQHSQEMGIAKVELLLQHDGLPMSTAKTKAAQAQRYAEISAAIDKETVKAYNDVLTRRLLETVADPGVIDTSAPDGIPPAGNKTETQASTGEF